MSWTIYWLCIIGDRMVLQSQFRIWHPPLRISHISSLTILLRASLIFVKIYLLTLFGGDGVANLSWHRHALVLNNGLALLSRHLHCCRAIVWHTRTDQNSCILEITCLHCLLLNELFPKKKIALISDEKIGNHLLTLTSFDHLAYLIGHFLAYLKMLISFIRTSLRNALENA